MRLRIKRPWLYSQPSLCLNAVSWPGGLIYVPCTPHFFNMCVVAHSQDSRVLCVLGLEIAVLKGTEKIKPFAQKG